MRRLRVRLTGRAPVVLAETHLLLLAIYGSERRFAHWTACWNGFVEDLAQARGDVRVLSVEPEPAEDGTPSFRPCRTEPSEAEWRATA